MNAALRPGVLTGLNYPGSLVAAIDLQIPIAFFNFTEHYRKNKKNGSRTFLLIQEPFSRIINVLRFLFRKPFKWERQLIYRKAFERPGFFSRDKYASDMVFGSAYYFLSYVHYLWQRGQ